MNTGFLQFSMSPLEILVRGSLMYWFLFAIFRFVLRRNASSAGVTDILTSARYRFPGSYGGPCRLVLA